jgi:lipoate-protein ligase A
MHRSPVHTERSADKNQTEDWMWSQTPQFDLLLDASDDIGIDMNVHHGIIKSLDFKDSRISSKVQDEMRIALIEQKLQNIRHWATFLQDRMGSLDDPTAMIVKRLDELLPMPKLVKS